MKEPRDSPSGSSSIGSSLGVDASVSYTLLSEDGGVLASQAAQAPHYAASLMKVPLAAAVLAYLQERGMAVSRRIAVPADFASARVGLRFRIPPEGSDAVIAAGALVSVEELLLRMIAVSSNDATNALIEFIGLDYATTWVDKHTTGLSVRRALYDVAADSYQTNIVTSEGMAQLLWRIGRGDLFEDERDEYLQWLLENQQYGDMIADVVPSAWRSAGKDGIASGAVHDSRLLTDGSGRTFVLVVLTTASERDLDVRIAAVRAIASAVMTDAQLMLPRLSSTIDPST